MWSANITVHGHSCLTSSVSLFIITAYKKLFLGMKPAAHWSSTTFSHIFTVWLISLSHLYLLGLCTSPLLLENQHQHICSMIVFNSQFKNPTALSLCQISHLHRFAIWATCTSTLHPLHSCPHFLFINTLHFLDHQPSSITPPPPLSHFSSFSSKYPIQPLQHTTFTRRHISTSILNPNLLHILSSPSCKSFFSSPYWDDPTV